MPTKYVTTAPAIFVPTYYVPPWLATNMFTHYPRLSTDYKAEFPEFYGTDGTKDYETDSSEEWEIAENNKGTESLHQSIKFLRQKVYFIIVNSIALNIFICIHVFKF